MFIARNRTTAQAEDEFYSIRTKVGDFLELRNSILTNLSNALALLDLVLKYFSCITRKISINFKLKEISLKHHPQK